MSEIAEQSPSSLTVQPNSGSGVRSLRGQQLKAVIKNVDMSEDMQQKAVDVVVASLDHHDQEKDMAMYIKKEFDRLYGTTWHCVVGKNFGSFVTHETKNFIYFYLGPIAILLWKTS